MKYNQQFLVLCMLIFFPGIVSAGEFKHTALDYEVCFTPGGNCTQDVVSEIERAKKQILVQAYSFTSVPIAKALVAAHQRGIDVRVILDKSQRTEQYSSARFLENQQIPAWIDYRVAIAHNKVMIIDNMTVITGSFNFTSAAQNKNAENLLILQDKELAKNYENNWYRRLAVSESATGFATPHEKHHSKRHHKQDDFFSMLHKNFG